MGKDLLVSLDVDVEEGEISDSASIEEISAEDFAVKSPAIGTEIAASKIAVDDDSKQQQPHQKVWTMQDLLKYQNKYQISRNYAPGLYNFAWAQAVQNKPLDDYLTTMNTSTTTDNLKQPLLNDDDNNNNIVVKEEDTVNNHKIVVDISDDGDSEKEEGELEEGEIDLDMDAVNAGNQGVKEDNVEKWINIIRIGLEGITITDAKKSFGGVCSRLVDFLDSLSKLLLENSVSNKDDLGHLAFSAIQLVNSVFSSMNQTQKQQNKHLLSRVLTNVKNNMLVIFSQEQLKEIEMMLVSCKSNKVPPNTESNNQEVAKISEETVTDEKQKQTESSQTQTSSSSSKNRVVLLPLLDLHKDHDVDTLPSPTRETTHSLPLSKALFNGETVIRPEWPAPKRVIESQNPVIHRYETDALKAVSTYQQKFGRSSFLSNDLPSPTPSEDSGGDTGGDTAGEVSSLSSFQNSIISEPSLVQKPSVQLVSNPVYSTSSSVTRVSNKTRDPRLRLANPEPSLDSNKQPVIEPLEVSRKQKTFDEPVLSDGPAPKRLKNGVPESVDPRLRVLNRTGSVESTVITSGLPSTSGTGSVVTGVSATSASLQSILKDIAVNPASWMNLINMEQQKSVDTVTFATQSSIQSSSVASVPTSTAVTQPLVEDSGKVRMKPRDPRRALHNKSLQKGNSKLDSKVSSSQPDITRQFTKNLKNIADIVSTSVSASVQIPSSQPAQVHSSFVNMKGAAAQPGRVQNGTGPASDEPGSGPGPSHGWGDVEQFFGRFDDQQRAAIQKERSKRMEEQKKMFAERKLCLVLDLDHTLLNSAKFSEVEPMHDEMLKKKEEQDREKSHRHLFRFPHMCMWTKLRPGIWNFLEKASKLYELHLYTMGNKLYATEMAKVLDPKGVLFNGRVISRGDDGDSDGDPKSKDLEGVLGMESAVVIIDDSIRVWPHNKLNLIVVERYIYFPCSRRQFGLPGPSLLEIDHDERPEDGTLASSLAVIEKIHQNFFLQQSLDDADVRNILASEQRKILGGCRIVFSRVFPVGEASPHLHPLWQTAEQFGAVCTNQIDEQVTHVVANSLGTDKVNWALATGRPVVHPGWVEASALLYRRANEHDFAVKP